MKQDHEIIAQVYAAKENSVVADQLVTKYLPFIQSETAKIIHRFPKQGEDDELSVAMLAFHESVLYYSKTKGNFLRFAATSIRNRLIDYYRKERRHNSYLSLDQQNSDADDDRTLLETLDSGTNETEELEESVSARSEISEFAEQLVKFQLTLTDIADNCPKQERTLAACHQALGYAKEHPILLEELVQSGRLPIAQLSKGSGISRKTLERHRKYMVAILLAYTNGFEIIRGHLRQVTPRQGGHI
ncbi:MAG: sigma-70 family RNA polymerase sigma factor [Candidatus Merdivicinus sp.]|jgi:RNA polymerase sigma factor